MAEQITTKPYSTTFKHLVDLKAHVGKELGLTEWIEMTQERINNFADTTEDHQWIHIDPEMSAKYSPYKTTIAHGFLVLSLASKMTYDTYKVEDVSMGVNYGLDKVRFPNATPVGALIRGRVSLLDYKDIPGGAQYVVKVVFELKGQEKPACVAEFVARAYATPEGQEKPDFNIKPEAKSANGVAKKATDAVLYQKEKNIAIITLNRPDRYNAAGDEVAQGLLEALQKVRNDKEVKTVVLTGNGKGFCAGADLQGGPKTPEAARIFILTVYASIVREIMALPKLVIAAINGPVAGVGCAFAFACDFRVMAQSANIRYAFINIALGPDGGAGWLLTRLVGYPKALQIAVEGEKISAEACLEMGLTNKVVANDQLINEAKSWAHRLSEKAPYAIAITKQALQYAMTHSLQETTHFEADNQVAALGSADFREGVTAFFEKRKPKFTGK